jgi:heterodisulfide reductase subunit D
MTNYKIILFLCTWGPHAAYQDLQHNGVQIPAEIKMVRIPCTGRISKALLLRAFEMGADGVALVGCAAGTCRHGTGTIAAQDNAEDMRNIIDLLGLGRERMRLATFLPDESDALKTFLIGFCEEIMALGKTSVQPTVEEIETPVSGMRSIDAIAKEHDVYSCQDCGKCTSSCPLALSGKVYSPRAIAIATIRGEVDSDQALKDIQSCLTCGICHERCPSDVNFPEFIRDMRRCIHENGVGSGVQPHGGFFHSMMRTMASPGVTTKRWTRISDDIQLDPESKTLFFGGCAPYFDAFFQRDQGVKTTDILTDSLRLLNFFNVHPRVLGAERCCGHDLLWSGDRVNFLRLAKLNVEMIRDNGVEEVITSCPECYRTLAVDYEKNGVQTGFKVTYLYEFLETEIDKGAVAFHPLEKKITYQDSCRLNRLEGQRAYPRKLIRRLTGTVFTEMQDTGRSALCCGNCAWTRCDAYNKALQVKRIRQARDTGSDLMVTSCPKCQIHLRCAMEDPFIGQDLSMEMADLTCIIAKTMHRE